MTNEIITLFANIALALSFIIGLVFGILQVRAAARDRKERLTLETLRNYQSLEFSELIFKINAATIPPTLLELRKLPDEDQIMILQFIQAMESLGILVAEHFISIELVDKTLGSFVTASWDKFKIMIMDIREKQPDPFLSEYYQWLAERLNERLKTNPRKPFNETR